jgi:hypothetical protein
VARGGDGSLYVTRHGEGRDGGIIAIPRQGRARNLAGLDERRRRIGLAWTEEGELISAFYLCGAGTRYGGVARVGADGFEEVLVGGLSKPVGVAVRNRAVYVSDQDTHSILRFLLDDPSPRAEPIAAVPRPDHLCLGPDDSLFVTSHFGRLYSVSAKGKVQLVEVGLGSPRGVACDLDDGRVFVTARRDENGRSGSNLYIFQP